MDYEKIFIKNALLMDVSQDRLTRTESICAMKEAIREALPEILQIVADEARCYYSQLNNDVRLDRSSITSLEKRIAKRLGLI